MKQRAPTQTIIYLCLLAGLAIRAFAEKQIPVEDFISGYKSAIITVQDYQCRITDYSIAEDEVENRVANFYFLAPRYMRMDIVTGNRFGDNGSRAVYLPDGTVTGKLRGLPIVRALGINDPFVTTIRGKTLEETDLLGILDLLLRFGNESTVEIQYQDGQYVVRVLHSAPEAFGGVDREVLYFSASNYLIEQVDSYSGDTLVQHFVFTDYIVNAGLPAKLFHVKYDAADLQDLDIATIAGLPVRERDLRESGLSGGN